ncbi:MAG: ATP-binding cassette domain-containing protein [Bacilli bacterium]|jgi:ABC-type lipoprotein export system ATPase subunit/ABC-type antimicrobial peptide transport system permease subunit|nr:ATP-binding cassette domain-containing protein [Bacilli bacterium]
MVLELLKISKKFRINKDTFFEALKDITLGFNKGEFISILGPSGCGKSTLLNIIAGLDKPSSGELIINKQSSAKYKQKQWDFYRKNNVGIVFQQFNLIEHLNALENVELSMTLVGLNKKKRKKRAYDLLAQVGISKEHALHLPSELSGGQKQRVAIARALANDPDIILADEPTGALDTKTGLLIMELLKEIAQDKLIIMVTHNHKLAYEYGTSLIKMLDGEIQSIEKLKDYDINNSSTLLKKKDAKMPFKDALKLSLRNMKKKFGRVFITALAGAIGISGITLVMGLSNGANSFINEQITRFGTSNVISIDKNVKEDNKLKAVEDINEFAFLKKNQEVLSIRKQLPNNGSWLIKDTSIDTQQNALAPTKNLAFIKPYLNGRLPKNNSNEVLVNKAMARKIIKLLNYQDDDYQSVLNNKIVLDYNSLKLPISEDFKIVGIIDELDVDAPYLYYDYEGMKSFLNKTKLGTSSLLSLLDQKGKFEFIIKDAHHLLSIKDWVLKENNQSQNNMLSSFMGNQEGVNISSFALIFQQSLQMIINIVQLVMIAFLVLALVVSSILIAIVLFASVLERKVEIGIIKAIGGRKKDIMRVFNAEAILIGLFSGLLGIMLAFILAPLGEIIVTKVSGYNFSNTIKIPLEGMININGSAYHIPFLQIIVLLLISIGVAFIAGYLPSRQATKMPVIDALRDE